MEISVSKLTNIVLASMFLTTLFFVVVTSSSGEYDPWLDYNDDGWINAKDAIALGMAFSSSGDPAKNVTIVGHATQLFRPAVSTPILEYESWSSGYIWVDGYAKVSVSIFVSNPGNFTFYVFACDYGGYSWLVESTNYFSSSWVKTYDVMNQQIWIEVDNWGAEAATLNIDVYLVA